MNKHAAMLLSLFLLSTASQAVRPPYPSPGRGPASTDSQLLTYLGEPSAAALSDLRNHYRATRPWGGLGDRNEVPLLFRDMNSDGVEDFCRVVDQAVASNVGKALPLEGSGPRLLTVVLCALGTSTSHWSQDSREERIAIIADPLPPAMTAAMLFNSVRVRFEWIPRIAPDGKVAVSLCREFWMPSKVAAGTLLNCDEVVTKTDDVQLDVVPGPALHVADKRLSGGHERLMWSDINMDGSAEVCWVANETPVPPSNVYSGMRPIMAGSTYATDRATRTVPSAVIRCALTRCH